MKSSFKFLLILLIGADTQDAACQGERNSVREIMHPIDSFIEKKMGESGMVGVGAAIIINKELTWIKGYGFADKENRVPFTPNTVMNVGSITKTFTGVCLMRAIEEKRVALDEDINNYLPFKVINPFFPNEKITLRQLATHTSSISDRYPFYSRTYHYGGDSPEQLGDFLRNYFEPSGKNYAKDNFINNKPGTYRQYSNIAAGLAGYIVEIATGKKLNEYSKKYIFDPLKMGNSGWFLSEIDLKNHSKLYSNETDTLKQIPLYGIPTYPDGGVRTSVSELARFFIALLNEGSYEGARILKKESVNEMQRFQFTASSKPDNVDIAELNSGIFWATKRNVSNIGHSGSDPGVKTEMLSDLSKEIGVILFTNTSLSDKETFKHYFPIFDELFRYGTKLRDANDR